MYRRSFLSSLLGALGLHAAVPQPAKPDLVEWQLYRISDDGYEPKAITWFDMKPGDRILAVIADNHLFKSEIWEIGPDGPFWKDGRIGDPRAKAVEVTRSFRVRTWIPKKARSIAAELDRWIARDGLDVEIEMVPEFRWQSLPQT